MDASDAPRKLNLTQGFASFTECWSPRLAGEVNGFQVKLARLHGEFVWHRHELEDELFLVVKGRLTMQLRSGDVLLEEGELLIVPRGVEHCPRADQECCVLLFEPGTTLNTGDQVNERTRRELERL